MNAGTGKLLTINKRIVVGKIIFKLKPKKPQRSNDPQQALN